jgi:hypothetical protein
MKSAIFRELAEDISSADLSFLNLESPLCLSGYPIKKCGPNLRADPSCIHAVSQAGFDVAGLANNHIMDYGQDGLEETMNACGDAGLLTCGAGKDLQTAQEPLFVTKKGQTIAIIAVAEREFSIAEENKAGVAPLDPIDNLVALNKAKKNADLIFVTIHGGNEYYPYPRPGLKKICRFFIDQGADGVICHHAHVPGAYEIYEKKPIVYSLGNLIFDHHNFPKGWNQGYAIRLEYELNTKSLNTHKIIPYTQSVAQGGVVKLQGDAKDDFLDMLNDYRENISDKKKYEDVWKRFCSERRQGLLMKIFMPFHFRGLGRLARIAPIENILFNNKSLYEKINYINCESHREMLLSILEERVGKYMRR